MLKLKQPVRVGFAGLLLKTQNHFTLTAEPRFWPFPLHVTTCLRQDFAELWAAAAGGS
jgi:hypothetical protein